MLLAGCNLFPARGNLHGDRVLAKGRHVDESVAAIGLGYRGRFAGIKHAILILIKKHDQIWKRQKAAWPQFAEYEEKTSRAVIPVIVLDPA